MIIRNGIAYADDERPLLKVSGVRPLDGHRLWVRFSTGETKVCDFTPLLSSPAFSPLQDATRFAAVYIDYGIPTWEDGSIDIAPEYLYQNGIPA